MKKKFLMVALFALVCCVAFTFANTVSAATNTESTTSSGTVTDKTISTSIAKADGSENEIIITYKKAQLEALKWDPANPSIGRFMNGWWIGFTVTAPDSDNYSAENATYTKPNSQGTTTTKKYTAALDTGSDKNSTFWMFIDQNTLNQNGSNFVLATYTFDWKGDGSNKLTVRIKVEEAEGTILKENNVSDKPSQMATVTIDGVSFTLKKGDSLNKLTSDYDIALLKSLKEGKEDEEFIGFFKDDGTEVKETDAIDENTVLTAKFKKIEKATTETKKEDKKDTTPKTGSVDMVMYIAIAVAVVSLAGTVITKKALNNK